MDRSCVEADACLLWLTRAYVGFDRSCASITISRYAQCIKAHRLGIRTTCNCSGVVCVVLGRTGKLHYGGEKRETAKNRNGRWYRVPRLPHIAQSCPSVSYMSMFTLYQNMPMPPVASVISRIACISECAESHRSVFLTSLHFPSLLL